MRFASIVAAFILVPASANAEMIRLKLNALPADTQSKMMSLGIRNSTADPAAAADPAASIKRVIDANATRKAIAESLLGKGYDMWGNQTFEPCVTPKKIVQQPFMPGNQNKNNVYHFRQIETLSDYHSNRTSGASVSIAYELFSFGAGTQEDSGQVFKMNNKYIDMHMVFIGDEYAMDDGSATPTATGRLSAAGEEGFAKICGQRFITRVGFGTTLDARLTATVSINAKTQSNQNDVSIGYGKILGFTANNAQTISDISQKSALSVDVAGAVGPMPKPEDLLEYGRTFGDPGTVGLSVQDVYIETTPYSEVGEKIFRKFDDFVKLAAGTVIGFQADRMQTVQQLADLETLSNNPGFMKLTGAGDIPKLIKDHRDFLNTLGKLYATCRKALDAAGIKECTDASAMVGPRPAKPFIEFTNQT